MNATRIKELMEEVDLILAEATEVPTTDANEAVARIADMGKLEAVKEILHSILRNSKGAPLT